jgi:hypothetical protein
MRPKELKDVSFKDVFGGKVELPDGVTRGRFVVELLQTEFHQIFNQSRQERDIGRVRYFLHGLLRAEGNINDQGQPHGEMRVFWPDGSTWIRSEYRDGKPCGNWREFLPDGTPLPKPAFLWIQHVEEYFSKDKK